MCQPDREPDCQILFVYKHEGSIHYEWVDGWYLNDGTPYINYPSSEPLNQALREDRTEKVVIDNKPGALSKEEVVAMLKSQERYFDDEC